MGVTPEGDLRRFNVSTGTVTTFPGVLPAGAGGYGAAWNFGNGNLGFSANTTGDIIQVELTNTSGTPNVRLVSVVSGPSSSLNDGASIPGLPSDLAIVKEAPEQVAPGAGFTYSFTVTNNGPGISSGWTVTDVLPAELSNPVVGGDASLSVDGQTLTLTGGRLAAGDSATFTVTVDADIEDGECVTNQASIFGNEADPEAGNNEDSAETCAALPSLSLEKTSDASADARPGDIINYTITATNTGTADYTEDNPAYVFDILTGVLDDATLDEDSITAQTPLTAVFATDRITITGDVPEGETLTVTYTVTVNTADNIGDQLLANFVVPSDPDNPGSEVPPTECDPNSTLCTQNNVPLPDPPSDGNDPIDDGTQTPTPTPSASTPVPSPTPTPNRPGLASTGTSGMPQFALAALFLLLMGATGRWAATKRRLSDHMNA